MRWSQWGRGIRERVEIPAKVLDLVTFRQGGKFCVMCRELRIQTPDNVPLEIDHKLALNKGGDNNHVNLQWLCQSHNRAKQAKKIGPNWTPAWARRRKK